MPIGVHGDYLACVHGQVVECPVLVAEHLEVAPIWGWLDGGFR